MIEYACYVNNYYGTPRAYVEEKLAEGKNVILEIEIQGALKIKKKFPESLLIFVTPPNAEELKRRLEKRGTESAEVIARRLARYSTSPLFTMVSSNFSLVVKKYSTPSRSPSLGALVRHRAEDRD